ncbi:hypothetical protein R6Q59_023185 [Mikania micrantha]
MLSLFLRFVNRNTARKTVGTRKDKNGRHEWMVISCKSQEEIDRLPLQQRPLKTVTGESFAPVCGRKNGEKTDRISPATVKKGLESHQPDRRK